MNPEVFRFLPPSQATEDRIAPLSPLTEGEVRRIRNWLLNNRSYLFILRADDYPHGHDRTFQRRRTPEGDRAQEIETHRKAGWK